MITCYYCKGKHELVAQVKACSVKTASPLAAKVETGKIVETAIPGTVGMTFSNGAAIMAAGGLKGIIEAKKAEKSAVVPAHRTSAKYLALKAQVAPAVEVVHTTFTTVDSVSPVKTIDQQVAEHDAALAVIKKGQDLEIGMYQVDGIVYKVDWNKAKTFKMASKLVIVQKSFYNKKTGMWEYGPKGKFYYTSGMMNKLTSENKMDEAAAKAFHDATKEKYGQEYGFCCVCGKLLTNQKSVAKGIGPVCEKYFA